MFFRQAYILQIVCAVKAFMSTSSNETSGLGHDTFLWPVVCLHIPKTAGNFATTIIRTGCNRDGIRVKRAWGSKDPGGRLPPGCTRRNFARMESGHRPLQVETPDDLPHVATLFREPLQRLMSGYFHGRHDCKEELHRVAPRCRKEEPWPSVLPRECQVTQEVTLERVERYAECAGSCQTHMVYGSWCNGRKNYDEVTRGASVSPVELEIVQDRIAHMGFVGLTDEYDLSVCLFHARFGGSCEASEFANRRPGTRHSSNHTYDVPMSEKLRNVLTEEFETYRAARDRFWSDVRNFGVGRSLCQRLCPHPPEVFSLPLNLVASAQASDFEYDWPGRLSFDVDSFE